MKKTFVISLTLVALVGSTAAFAKNQLPRVLQGADIVERPAAVQANPSLVTSTSSDTFVWGPYDFENGWGTGSNAWTAVDLTVNASVLGSATNLTFAGSRGNGSLFTGKVGWTGTLGNNACGTKACFPGYDNNTNQVMWKSYTLSAGSHLQYAYRADSEPGYDFTYVIVSTAGAPTLQGDGSYKLPTFNAGDTLTSYTSYVEGNEDLDLSSYGTNAVTIYFLSVSDGGYSDGDCNYNSLDGMFEIDNLGVGGESPIATFESGTNGWTFSKVSGIGKFAKIEASSGLPNSDPCPTFCGITGNCVTIYDGSDPNFHPANQNELIMSPVLNLTQNPSYPVGSYVMQFDTYFNLALNNGNFYFWHVRYSPVEIADCSCQDPTDWSSWLDENTIYYGGGIPTCGTALQFNVSAKVPGHATRLQMAVGVINYQVYVSVPGGNQSPYFDNISLRAAKVSAPAVVMGPWDFLQSAYPDAATFAIAKGTPAYCDTGLNNWTPGRIHTRLGDSTTCSVALSCNSDQKTEVDYLFKVTPGPCMNLSHPWYVAYLAQPKIASGKLAGFAVARADTARTSTGANSASAGFGTFMSRFNEVIPAAGTTYAGLGNWSGYTGGAQGINIFPDDLFTPGTHVEWVVHTTYIPVKTNGDYYQPDQKYGNGDGDILNNQIGNQHWKTYNPPTNSGSYDPTAAYVEQYEVLPLTTTDGTTNCAGAAPAHCFLYVDKWDQRGPQYQLEFAFRNLNIAWDRFDVRASTSAMGNDLGSRYTPANYPLGHANGPLPSLLNEVYKAILWQTGSGNSTNFSRGSTASGADAGNAIGILSDWLTTTGDGKYLWVNGDGNSRFLNATGNRITFLNTVLGTTYIGPQYRDKSTAWGVNLTGLGPDCTTGLGYALRGNWCPQRRSYVLVDKYTGTGSYGAIAQNFKYPDAPTSTIWYASVQQTATTGGFNFRTQNDNWSADQLRQSGVVYAGVNDNSNITNWAARALSSCFTGCFTNLNLVGVADNHNVAVNSLAAARGPITGGQANISFSLATDGKVSVRVYDAAGRLVSTVVDNDFRSAGSHTEQWNASGLKGGVYFYQITANGFKSAKKIILVN
jgi:hypothetical protein